MGLPCYSIQANSFLPLSHHFSLILPFLYSFPLLWTKHKQNISFDFLLYISLIQSFYTYFLFCFHSVIYTSPHFFLQATCILTEIFLWPHASRCWPSVVQSQLRVISWAHCTKPLRLLSLNPSHTSTHSVPMATVLVCGISNKSDLVNAEWVWHVCGASGMIWQILY